MSLNALGIGLAFTAKDMATGVMGDIEDKFKGLYEKGTLAAAAMDKSFASFKAGMGIFASGLGMLAGIGAIADAYNSLDDALDHVAANTNLTQEEMDRIEVASLTAALSGFNFTADQSVAAMEELSKGAGGVADAEKSLGDVLALAQVANMGAAETASLVTRTMKQYADQHMSATEVSNLFARSAQVSGIAVRDLQMGLMRAGPVASGFNQSLEQTLAGMALFAKAGGEGRFAIMAYSQALQHLGANKKVQAELEAKGVDVYDKTSKKMRAFPDIIQGIIKATKGMEEADKKAFLVKTLGQRGDQALKGFEQMTYVDKTTKAVLKGADAVKAITAEMTKAKEGMGDAADAAKKLNAALLNDLGGQKDLIGKAMSAIVQTMGKDFGEALKPVAVFVLDKLQAFGKALLAMDPEAKQFLARLSIGIALLTAFVGAILAVASAAAILTLVLAPLGLSFAGFLAVVTLLTGAVVGLGFATRDYFSDQSNVDSFTAKIHTLWVQFQALVSLFSKGEISGKLLEEFDAIDGGAQESVIKFFVWGNKILAFFEGVQEGFSRAWDTMGPTFDKLEAAFARFGVALGITSNTVEANTDALAASQQKGKDFGKVIGNMVDAVLRLTTRLVEVSAAAVEFYDHHLAGIVRWTVETVDRLGGFETILNLIILAMGVRFATSAVRMVGSLIEIGGAALSAAASVGKFVAAHAIETWGTFATGYPGAAAGIANGVRSIGAAASTAAIPLAAVAAALMAIYQAKKLYDEWDESSLDVMRSKAHYGDTSSEANAFWRGKTGRKEADDVSEDDDYYSVEMQNKRRAERRTRRVVPAVPTPAEAATPAAAPAVADTAAATAGAPAAVTPETIAAHAAQAAMVAAAGIPMQVVQSHLLWDHEVLLTAITQVQRGQGGVTTHPT